MFLFHRLSFLHTANWAELESVSMETLQTQHQEPQQRQEALQNKSLESGFHPVCMWLLQFSRLCQITINLIWSFIWNVTEMKTVAADVTRASSLKPLPLKTPLPVSLSELMWLIFNQISQQFNHHSCDDWLSEMHAGCWGWPLQF